MNELKEIWFSESFGVEINCPKKVKSKRIEESYSAIFLDQALKNPRHVGA